MALVLGIVVALMIEPYHDELSLNLVSEILGGAFLIFVIDVLLVRSKTKQWKVVQEQCDYLIARNVSRIREGLVYRAFGFRPHLKQGLEGAELAADVRNQRDDLLDTLKNLPAEELAKRIVPSLFTESNFDYFEEKSNETWNLLNMKHAEYLAPELVAMLMDLNTSLKDLGAHIRMYGRSEQFEEERIYYQRTGIKGAAHTLRDLIEVLIELKEEGYSEPARA